MAALELKVEKLEGELAEERAANSNSNSNQNNIQPDVVKTALARNMLLPNGTFRGNIRITSDAELVVMLPLLEYIINIEGDLYISSLTWLPTLDDVLALLVKIAGSLFIGGCTGLQSLANALPKLVEVGNALTLSGNSKLETATLYAAFPLLETVDGKPLQTKANSPEMDDDGVYTGDLQVSKAADFVTKRDMLKDLTKVTKGLNLNTLSLADLDNMFLALKEVGGGFTLTSSSALQTMTGAFPNLAKVGASFKLNSNSQLISVDGAFLLLGEVGESFNINSNSQHLVSMDGSFLVLDSATAFMVSGNNRLKSMDGGTFGKLTKTTTGEFTFIDSALESVDGIFPLLASVAGYFNFNDHNQVQTMDGAFPMLSTVGSYLSIQRNDKLTTLGADGGFKALSSIGSLYFYANGDNGAGNVENNPGLVSFCESAKQKLCGMASTYSTCGWFHGADECC